MELPFDVSTLLVAQYKLEKKKHRKMLSTAVIFFTTIAFRDNFYCTFITFSRIERNFSFFSRARNYFFTTVVFAIDDWPVSAKSVYQFPRVLCAEFTMYYRRYIESARSHRENRWMRRVGWRELSCEKKRDKADRPPSMMMAVSVGGGSSSFSTFRVPAVFLVLFNNCALSLDAISCFSSGSFHPQTLLIRSCQRNFRDQRKIEK